MPGNGHVRFGGRPGRKRTSTAGTSPPGPPYPHRAGPVPRRGRRPAAEDRGPGGDEPAVPGLGRDRLPPGGPLRDRRGAPRPLGRPPRPSGRPRGPGLREAFLWSERRTGGQDGPGPLHGNSYQVDAWLAGRCVELVFDPFDLDRSRSASAGKPPGPPSRSPSAGTPTPRPARSRCPARRAPRHRDRLPRRPRRQHDRRPKEQVNYRSLIDGDRRPQG